MSHRQESFQSFVVLAVKTPNNSDLEVPEEHLIRDEGLNCFYPLFLVNIVLKYACVGKNKQPEGEGI